MKTEEKIKKIHSELNDGRITVSQATEQMLNLISAINRFDIDGSKLSIEDQHELRRLFWDGNVNIKIVLK